VPCAVQGKPISRLEAVKPRTELADDVFFNIGLLLALVGFAVGIVAILVAILRSARGSGQVRGGGVVMIGPVPIVFGTDKQSARILILLGIVLMIILLLFTVLPMVWR
jgi:uncharacterized protein (TIGR00304 family)